MANYLDFLRAVDDYTRSHVYGSVPSHIELHQIARDAGLVKVGELTAANWTGQLVYHEYLTHGLASGGDPRPVPPGPIWTDSDVQRFHDYRVTAKGREEADRARRLAREARTDAALGTAFPQLLQPWMTSEQRAAISQPLRQLHATLDHGDPVAAIGAAKNLVEAACKIVLDRAAEPVPRSDLPVLFKLATAALPISIGQANDLGKSLTATVQRLSELRNVVGAAHGQEALPDVTPRHARLAASGAVAVATFLLDAG